MECLEFGNPLAERVLLQPVDQYDLEGMDQELAVLRKAGGDFRLLAFRIRDWNRELSPWEAAPVFGKEGFGAGAPETLAAVLERCGEPGKRYYLGGYSLAGLFALWAAGQTDRFAGIAAASPSVWFPGLPEYLEAHPPRTGRIYLSLGDREEKTRNPVMAQVGDRIRRLHSRFLAQGLDCALEWNPGSHFRDPALRTARAFAWVLEEPAGPLETRSRL